MPPPPAPPPDERALLDALRRGDEDAAAELVRHEAPRLLALARRILGDEQAAEDALQQAFSQAFAALERFAGDSRLSTWLHRITVNAALMLLRRRSRRAEVSLEELLPRFLPDGHHADPPDPWAAAPLEEASRHEREALVREAIARLPEIPRNVLLLRDIEGLDTQQTAQALGITPNAVKTRLHRARQALRALLDPHFREAGP